MRSAPSAPAPAPPQPGDDGSDRLSTPQRLLRRFASRERLDSAIDRLRLRIDNYPYGAYQPIDGSGLPPARGDGSQTRWEAMAATLDDLHVETAIDIGANAGFFSLQLAARGIATTAIESDPGVFRSLIYAVRQADRPNLAAMSLHLAPGNLELVPAADCTLCLSVWHHWVRSEGFEAATDMLAELWRRTGNVLFFDTGENEMPASFGLPAMEPDAERWLGDFLATTCPGAEVRSLGGHQAFDAQGKPCHRTLFAVLGAAA